MKKISQYIHRPNLTELGMGNTNDKYLVCPESEVKDFFPEGKDTIVLDEDSGKSYTLYSKIENREFRVKRLSEIFDNYQMDPGDELIFTRNETNDSVNISVRVNECGRIFLNQGKRESGLIKDFEIINLERFPGFSKDTPYDNYYSYMGEEHHLEITFSQNRPKRKDSPQTSDFYNVKYDGKELENLKNTYYYLTIRKGVAILKMLPKFELITLLEDNMEAGNTKVDTANRTFQQIFYGAPGTGKSFKTNEVAKKYSTIRTTFHPDSDYSTFVGAYKPTTKKEDRYELNGSNTVALEYPAGEKAGKTITESKIEYRFVKQAFLKAYINAWKKFAKADFTSFSHLSTVEIESSDGIDKWILNSVDDSCVYYTKESRLDKDRFGVSVMSFWGKLTESDDPDNYGPGTNEMYEGAACIWYRNGNSIEHRKQECWDNIINTIEKGEEISSRPGGNQTYFISLEDNKVIVRTKATAKRKTINDNFVNNPESSRSSIQIKIAQKLKEYNCGLDEAWKKLEEEVNNNCGKGSEVLDLNNIQPQFLVIEEINRGNCAQIFGDLFQLLDRKKGFSEYPIDADEDICKCLMCEDTVEDPSFGTNGLSFSHAQKRLINEIYNSFDAPYRDVADEIAKGKVLVLPCNLYIWATMNTSDQSLFPIDSAFKRRWEWVYMPIKNHEDKGYKIEIDDTTYDWWGFLEKINSVINNVTNSEDKKLGYFFVKTDKKIDAKKFVGKVLFYLWNDVFKNYGFDNPIFNKEDNNKYAFSDFFKEDGSPEMDNIKLFLKNLDETIDKEKPFTEKKQEVTNSKTVTENPDLFANQE